MNEDEEKYLTGAYEALRDVKTTLSNAMGLGDGLSAEEYLQITAGEHPTIAPDTEFVLTAEQLCDAYCTLSSVAAGIHFARGGTFKVAATGTMGDPPGAFMPSTILPEAESILRPREENADE
jgi:hypothetical protein